MPLSARVSHIFFTFQSGIQNAYHVTHGIFSSKETLLDTIDLLESQNSALRTELAELGRDMTGFSDDIPVSSLFSPLSTLYDSFLISRGYSSGVETGMIVYEAGFLPVGVVDEVHDKNSRVKLLSSHDSELESFVASSSLIVRLRGNGGGDFIAELPKDVTVAMGDILMWKDHPHMMLGKIIKIDSQPQSVSQKIYVQGIFNPSLYKQLYLLTH